MSSALGLAQHPRHRPRPGRTGSRRPPRQTRGTGSQGVPGDTSALSTWSCALLGTRERGHGWPGAGHCRTSSGQVGPYASRRPRVCDSGLAGPVLPVPSTQPPTGRQPRPRPRGCRVGGHSSWHSGRALPCAQHTAAHREAAQALAPGLQGCDGRSVGTPALCPPMSWAGARQPGCLELPSLGCRCGSCVPGMPTGLALSCLPMSSPGRTSTDYPCPCTAGQLGLASPGLLGHIAVAGAPWAWTPAGSGAEPRGQARDTGWD